MDGGVFPTDATILFGAGVGVEAGLPTAPQLIEAIAHAFVLDAQGAAELARLSQPSGPLRFETAMDWLSETADRDLRVLSFLDKAEPGPLHQALAWAAAKGARLVTVNFDDLAERAVSDAAASPWTIDAYQAGAEAPAGAVRVLKLHGTRRLHGSQGVRPADRPLQATITQIVRDGGAGGLPEQAHQLLAGTIDWSPLVVIGYSGSDDLDVMPSLQRCSPSRVLWIQARVGVPGSGGV
jgi:SIR2-like domain